MLCIALGSFLGCSSQEKYKVLTFFFDGVPAPGGLSAMNAEGQTVAYLHKPYADGKCGSCHESDDVEMSIARPMNIAAISSSVCLNCHEGARRGHAVMHGPVVAGECLTCHAPHESTDARILRAPSPRVCTQCHTPETILSDIPQHKDGTSDCLSCHSGHGGATHDLLRADYSSTGLPAISAGHLPTTRPAVSAAYSAGGGL